MEIEISTRRSTEPYFYDANEDLSPTNSVGTAGTSFSYATAATSCSTGSSVSVAELKKRFEKSRIRSPGMKMMKKAIPSTPLSSKNNMLPPTPLSSNSAALPLSVRKLRDRKSIKLTRLETNIFLAKKTVSTPAAYETFVNRQQQAKEDLLANNNMTSASSVPQHAKPVISTPSSIITPPTPLSSNSATLPLSMRKLRDRKSIKLTRLETNIFLAKNTVSTPDAYETFVNRQQQAKEDLLANNTLTSASSVPQHATPVISTPSSIITPRMVSSLTKKQQELEPLCTSKIVTSRRQVFSPRGGKDNSIQPISASNKENSAHEKNRINITSPLPSFANSERSISYASIAGTFSFMESFDFDQDEGDTDENQPIVYPSDENIDIKKSIIENPLIEKDKLKNNQEIENPWSENIIIQNHVNENIEVIEEPKSFVAQRAIWLERVMSESSDESDEQNHPEVPNVAERTLVLQKRVRKNGTPIDGRQPMGDLSSFPNHLLQNANRGSFGNQRNSAGEEIIKPQNLVKIKQKKKRAKRRITTMFEKRTKWLQTQVSRNELYVDVESEEEVEDITEQPMTDIELRLEALEKEMQKDSLQRNKV